MFSITEINFVRWQAFITYRSASSGLREMFSPLILFKIIILYNIFYSIFILLHLNMRCWCCLSHIDITYLFYFIFVVVLFVCLFIYFCCNLMKHKCWSAEVNYSFILWPRCYWAGLCYWRTSSVTDVVVQRYLFLAQLLLSKSVVGKPLKALLLWYRGALFHF